MRFSELDGASIGVWGAGGEIRSFAAHVARRLPSARITVVAFDERPDDVQVRWSISNNHQPKAPAAQVVVGADALPALSRCDVVVRSPGVSIHKPELIALRGARVPVTTATALWLAEHGPRGVIGVSGTKGKSTTAALAHHLARAAGVNAVLAGNIGVPALDLLDREPFELAVVELSSYQIADLEQGPEVAVITNLFREHADWHGSEQAYRAEKLRLLALPGVRAAVIGGRGGDSRGEIAAAAGEGVEMVRYGEASGWNVNGGGVARSDELVVPVEALPLVGEHNALNLCAALTALEAAGVSLPPLPQALRDFQPLAHRLQTVLYRDGVTWVDDSISTTPESTLAALDSFPGRPLVLIAGGQDRGQDYSELADRLVDDAVTVIGVPSTGGRLVGAARAAGAAPKRALEAGDLQQAVRRAAALARPGGVVLLSPAAPSYDNFRNFEERGERFRELAGSP